MVVAAVLLPMVVVVMFRVTIGGVYVIVGMGIDGQHALGGRPEEAQEFRIAADVDG